MSNIHFVEDGEAYDIDGRIVLFVGGAISIDRSGRKQNVDYWAGEAFRWEREWVDEAVERFGGIDIVVTHTAPHFCYPVVKGASCI